MVTVQQTVLCADAAVIGEKQPFGPILRSSLTCPNSGHKISAHDRPDHLALSHR